MLVAASALLLGLSVRTGAQPTEAAATTVAQRFFAAVAEERWRDAVRFLDLGELETMRRDMIAGSRRKWKHPEPTLDDVRQSDPQMPPEVAEYQLRKWREAIAQPTNHFAHDFAEVESADQLEALSAEEAAARWLRAQDRRWTMRQAVASAREVARRRGCAVDTTVTMGFPAPAWTILATAVRDSAAYVIIDEDTAAAGAAGAGFFAGEPRVVRMRWTGGQWRIVATHAALGQKSSMMVDLCRPVTREP